MYIFISSAKLKSCSVFDTTMAYRQFAATHRFDVVIQCSHEVQPVHKKLLCSLDVHLHCAASLQTHNIHFFVFFLLADEVLAPPPTETSYKKYSTIREHNVSADNDLPERRKVRHEEGGKS